MKDLSKPVGDRVEFLVRQPCCQGVLEVIKKSLLLYKVVTFTAVAKVRNEKGI